MDYNGVQSRGNEIKNINIFTAYTSMWKNTWNFSARTSRKSYWLAVAACAILNLIAIAFQVITQEIIGVGPLISFFWDDYGVTPFPVFYFYSKITMVVFLLQLIPFTGLLARRMIDMAANPSYDLQKIIKRGKLIGLMLYAFVVLTAFYHGIIFEFLTVFMFSFFIYVGFPASRKHPEIQKLEYV